MTIAKVAYGFSVLGEEDQEEFSFLKKLSYDELTELLERNPRVSMMCDWISAEVIKNGWEWEENEELTFEISIPTEDNKAVIKETRTIDKDEFLELIKFDEKLQRAFMFARLHGTSVMEIKRQPGKLPNAKVWHRSSSRTGWTIRKDDVEEQNLDSGAKKVDVKTLTLLEYPPVDDPALGKNEPGERKLNLMECVIFKNPMKGETWGGTPSSKMISHMALGEELVLKLMVKHALDMVDNWYHIKNTKSEGEASGVHEELKKFPLRELYTKDLEIEAMTLNIPGKSAEFAELFKIMKEFMANSMRVSMQSMDGAPEGTISSAEYNTMIAYAVIEQIQNHFKPYMIEAFLKLGIEKPNFTWNKPMVKLDDQPEQRKPGQPGEPGEKGQGSSEKGSSAGSSQTSNGSSAGQK